MAKEKVGNILAEYEQARNSDATLIRIYFDCSMLHLNEKNVQELKTVIRRRRAYQSTKKRYAHLPKFFPTDESVRRKRKINEEYVRNYFSNLS